MQTSPEFPGISDDDSSDLTLALQTANALWKQGDPAEALRWLRRAAETAEADGKDDRALELARAAADLRERAGTSSTPPPVESSQPSRRPPSLPAPPPRVVLPPVGKAEALADASDQPTPRPSARPPAAATPSAVPKAPAPRTLPPRVASPPPRSSSVPPSRSLPSVPPLGAAAPGASPREGDSPGGARAALRVSVELFSAQSGTLLVRILGEGESAPAGTHEALIVPLSAGVDLSRLEKRRATASEGDPVASERRKTSN